MIDISSVKPITGRNQVNVAVEIPKGSICKYEYDNLGKELRVVRFLHKKWRYPFNYGCIPNTLEQDGDMLDAIVLCDEPLWPGTLITCTVYGAVETIDKGEIDNKIICIPTCLNVKRPTNRQLKKVLYYLKHYKYPDQATTQIGALVGYKKAMQFVENAAYNFERVNKRFSVYAPSVIVEPAPVRQVTSVFEKPDRRKIRTN